MNVKTKSHRSHDGITTVTTARTVFDTGRDKQVIVQTFPGGLIKVRLKGQREQSSLTTTADALYWALAKGKIG